jgi:hypothetical protein
MRRVLFFTVAMVLLSGAAWGQNTITGGVIFSTECEERCRNALLESGTTGQYLSCLRLCDKSSVLKGHMEDPTAWKQIDDATIRELAKNGSVCRVIGHRWEDGCGVPGCAVFHANPMRHCVICGKTETQEVGPWK